MIGRRVLLWQSDGLEEKALLPQYLVHGNNGPTGQTDFFVDSLLDLFSSVLACGGFLAIGELQGANAQIRIFGLMSTP